MRVLACCICLLLPQALFAQFKGFEPGYYVLVDNRKVQYPAKLKLRDQNTLLVKDDGSQKEKVSLEEVLYFQIGTRKFAPVGSFTINRGLGTAHVNRGFAERLDSGNVLLYEYRYLVANAPSQGGYGGNSWISVYLFQHNTDEDIQLVLSGNGASKQFRDALTPYVATRPDLQKLLHDRKISFANLVPFVQALNSGQPFSGPFPQPPTREPY